MVAPVSAFVASADDEIGRLFDLAGKGARVFVPKKTELDCESGLCRPPSLIYDDKCGADSETKERALKDLDQENSR